MRKGAYMSLIRNLVARFPDDPCLQRDLQTACNLAAIIEALALSYARLVKVACIDETRKACDHAIADNALSAAEEREAMMRNILDFFERTDVLTHRVRVRRTGPRGVRVRWCDLAVPVARWA